MKTSAIALWATAVLLAGCGGTASAQERCEASSGTWHAESGHGADAAHCMGGDAADR